MKRHLLFLLTLLSVSVIVRSYACASVAADREALQGMTPQELLDRGRASDNREEALLCFSLAVERTANPTDAEEARLAAYARNNCGYLLFHAFEEYGRSYSYFAKALEQARRYGLSDIESMASLNLGNLYLTYANRHSSKEETATARKFYSDGMKVALKVKNYELAVLNFTNLCAIELDDLSPRKLPKDMKDFMRIGIPDTTRGLAYAKGMFEGMEAAMRGDLDQARRKIKTANNRIDARYARERYEYATYAFMAKTFRMQGKWDSVLHYNRLIERLAEKNPMPDVRPDNFKDMSECYGRLGDNGKKDVYWYKYLSAKDSLLSIGRLDEVGNMRLLDRIDSTTRDLKETQEKHLRQRSILWITVGVLLCVSTIAVFIIKINRRLRHKNEILYNANLNLLRSEEERRNALKKIQLNDAEAKGKEEDRETDSLPASGKIEKTRPALNADLENAIKTKIDEVFDNPEIYCSPTFSLSDLVTACESNSKYVSQVIADRYGHGFSQLLSDNRVKEACRRIDSDPKYLQLTVEAISANVGFKSRVTFLTGFKRVTGLTPSQYITLARRRIAAENKTGGS